MCVYIYTWTGIESQWFCLCEIGGLSVNSKIKGKIIIKNKFLKTVKKSYDTLKAHKKEKKIKYIGNHNECKWMKLPS